MIIEGREINGQRIYIDTDTHEIVTSYANSARQSQS